MRVSADSMYTDPPQESIYPSMPFVVYFTVELDEGETPQSAAVKVRVHDGASTDLTLDAAVPSEADAATYVTYVEVAGLPEGQFWAQVMSGGNDVAGLAIIIAGSVSFGFDQAPDVQPARPGPQQGIKVTWQGKNEGTGVSPDTGLWDQIRVFDYSGEVKAEAWFQVPATQPGATYNGEAEFADGFDPGYYVVGIDQANANGTVVPSPQREFQVMEATEM